ncbi:Hypothetical predicted protein [Octopus vulgaris]|uniref:Uncharacterized protein n=1 Tax=Octopus vulgaris TaxID=6645 RepID=A0AA36BXK5_OCTVU|nr:Hypothetical predicted protein [Octopus vulgaris]
MEITANEKGLYGNIPDILIHSRAEDKICWSLLSKQRGTPPVRPEPWQFSCRTTKNENLNRHIYQPDLRSFNVQSKTVLVLQ